MLSEATNPVGIRDRMLLVRSINSLGELSEHAMLLLAEHARERHYQAGEVVQDEGEPIEFVHFVVRGDVVVSRKGVEIVVANDGGTIGMISLMARDPWGVKAVARTPAHTLEIPAEVIFDVYEESRSFLRTAIKYSAMGLVAKRSNLPVTDSYDPGDDMGIYLETPPTLVERIIEMRSSPFFANRNLDAVVDIARIGKYFTAQPGEKFWEVGDEATYFMSISYGRIRCTAEDGQEAVVAASYTLGIMDSLGRMPRPYTAVAETEIQGTKVDVGAMLAALETHHELAMDMLANISTQILPRTPEEVAEMNRA